MDCKVSNIRRIVAKKYSFWVFSFCWRYVHIIAVTLNIRKVSSRVKSNIEFIIESFILSFVYCFDFSILDLSMPRSRSSWGVGFDKRLYCLYFKYDSNNVIRRIALMIKDL